MKGDSTNKLLERVSRNVRALRTELGITQQELAERAGFRVAYVSRLESIPQNLTLSVLGRLAIALKCPIDRLVTDREALCVPAAQTRKLDQAMSLLREFRQRIYD